MNGIQVFNEIINKNLIRNTGFLSGRAAYVPAYNRIFRNLKKCEKYRTEIFNRESLTVPPILIISVTNDCNLECSGCYANAQNRCLSDEITTDDLMRIVGEAVSCGVGIVFLAGGEPLIKKGILDLPRRFRETLFVMFTNGLLIDDAVMAEFGRLKNIVPAFSLEGSEAATDARRGRGVFSAVDNVMRTMDSRKLMFGASITLTRKNYAEVMDRKYLSNLDNAGCRALFLIEYVPCEGDPENCLTAEQKDDLLEKTGYIRQNYSMIPVALPGDEEKFAGCLAAGRGFLHVSSTGAVEACPFAPFSDVNLKEISFEDALRSRLLGEIRKNHHLLEEAEGGCALFENKEWVEQLIEV